MPQNLCYVEVHFPCHLRDVSACLRVRCSKKLVVSSRKCVNQPWWLQVEECSEQVESVNVAFFFFSPVTFRQILLNVSRFLYETLKVCSVYRLFLSSSLVFISPRLVSVRFFFCFVFLFVFLGSYLSSFFFFFFRSYLRYDIVHMEMRLLADRSINRLCNEFTQTLREKVQWNVVRMDGSRRRLLNDDNRRFVRILRYWMTRRFLCIIYNTVYLYARVY